MFAFPMLTYTKTKSSQTKFFASFSQSTFGAPFLQWSNLSNLGAFDNVHADADPATGSFISETIFAKNGGFSIPESAVITGLQASVERHYTGGDPTTITGDIFLFKHGGGGGSKVDSGIWVNGSDVFTHDYGGDGDLWDTTWNAANINGADFSVGYRTNGTGGAATVPKVDGLRAKAFFEV